MVVTQIEEFIIKPTNGWCMRCKTGANICESWIISTAGEMNCKERDRQYGVHSMLAVVIKILYSQDTTMINL